MHLQSYELVIVFKSVIFYGAHVYSPQAILVECLG